MYCRLLDEAVKEIRGNKPVEKEREVSVDIAVEAFIPTEYISDAAARVAVYQKLSAAHSMEDVDAAEKELSDRFGADAACGPDAAFVDTNQGRRPGRGVF